MKKKKENFFKTRKVIIFFAIVSLIEGFLFIHHNLAGNIILNNKYLPGLILLTGSLLLLCSGILIVYSAKEK